MLLSSHLQLFAATTAFVVNVIAQTCNNPIFIVCTAPTNNVKPLSGTSGSQISDPTLFDWGSLDSVSSLPIGKRQLLPRQTTDENAVCCNPDIDCLVLQNIPFCYNEATTEFVLPDGSYGFVGNSTYYTSDGSFIDYGTGSYSSADGATGTFAPATATGGAAASTSNLSLFSVEAVASNTASAPQGPIQTSANKAVSGQQSMTTTTSRGGATSASANSGTSSTGSASQGAGKSQAAPGSLGKAASWMGCIMVSISIGVFYLL